MVFIASCREQIGFNNLKIFLYWLFILSLCTLISGCQTSQKSSKPSGGFYGGDQPPDRVPSNIASIPNAIPVALEKSKTGNKPYVALGKKYFPLKTSSGYKARGVASWYGKKFHGRRTSSGEPYDMFAMTAAHPVLPLPSFVKVTSLDNGRWVIVKVNDRGPFLHNRIIDLSYAAAAKLGITRAGTGNVEVEALQPHGTTPTAKNSTSVAVEQDTSATGVAGLSSVSPRGQPDLYIQLGVFASLHNALSLRRRLVNSGYMVFPREVETLIEKGAPYSVLAGPYSDRSQAQKAKQSIEQTFRQPVFVKSI